MYVFYMASKTARSIIDYLIENKHLALYSLEQIILSEILPSTTYI